LPRPPQLPAELESVFGIGLRVSADRVEIDTPRDGPPSAAIVNSLPTPAEFDALPV